MEKIGILKIILNYDIKEYDSKPDEQEIVKIQSRTDIPKEITLGKLFDLIVHGITFRPAAIQGTKNDNWISQQLFAIDIDNSIRKQALPEKERITPEQAIKRAREFGLYPNLVYPTFRNGLNGLDKFRILFVFNEAVTDRSLRDAIQNFLLNLYPKTADTSCKNTARLFFGTNKPEILRDCHSINKLEDIKQKIKMVPRMDTLENKTTPKKQKTIKDSSEGFSTPSNIELIKAGNSRELRKKLGRKRGKVFTNQERFFDYIFSSLDIAKLLEIETPNSFSCIFHDDEKPSASIFKTTQGIYLYKCFSCDMTLNIKQVIELLQGAKSEYKVIEFIKSAYNLRIKETEWSIEQGKNIDAILNTLYSTGIDGFKSLCPTAHNNLTRMSFDLYIAILHIAKKVIFPWKIPEYEGNVIFNMSIEQLKEATRKSSTDKVNKQLKLLIFHNMLEILPDDEIPPQNLKRAMSNRQNEKYRHRSFYRIPSWVISQLRSIEEQGKRWKANGYRINGISYEFFIRNGEIDTAKRLYPQYSTIIRSDGKVQTRCTTEKSDKITLQLSDILLEDVEKNGYTTESQVISKASKVMNKTFAEIQLKRSINEILSLYNLQKVRANNDFKKLYSISSSGYPMIIVKRN